VTWYAHHVFAEPRPDVVAALRAVFPDSLYHVPDLRRYDAVRSEVYAIEITDTGSVPEYREVIDREPFPRGGLLVVRELCAPVDPDGYSEHCREWFGAAATSWSPVPSSERGPILVPAADALPRPPEELLGFLRRVSRDTASVVSFFGAHTWGGDLEYATAWVFDGRDGVDTVYAESTTDDHAVMTGSRGEKRVIDHGDALTLTLLHHGALLDRGLFKLHGRSFPWAEYRLT
jgi:hypothetical protein